MKTLLTVLLISLAFISGCNNSLITEPNLMSNREQEGNNTDNSASYQFTLKVTQHSSGVNTVVLNVIYNTTNLGITSPVNFNTLASRDGVSTFTVEWGASWTNAQGNFGIHKISKNSSGDKLNSVLSLNPSSGGSYSNTQSISLLENTTYSYQLGPELIPCTNCDDE